MRSAAARFSSHEIDDWGCAQTPQQQRATLDLLDAIVAGNRARVSIALAYGAAVHAVIRPPRDLRLVAREMVRGSPLDLALHVEPLDRSTGVIEALLAAGAPPPSSLRDCRFARSPDASRSAGTTDHPACTALETAILNRIAQGQEPPLTPADRDRITTLVSILPDTGATSLLWVHRALILNRWDVVNAWLAHGGVACLGRRAGFPPIVPAFWLLRLSLDEQGAADPQSHQAIDRLATALLAEPNAEAFHHEMMATLMTYHSHQRPPLSLTVARTPGAGRTLEQLGRWCEQVLTARPLTRYRLQPGDVLAPDHDAVQAHLIALEKALLRRAVGDSGTSTTGRPLRPRL